MTSKVERQDRKLATTLFAFTLAILVAVGLVVFISVREGNRAGELEEALIENCQTSPVREALSEILQEEVDESHSPLTTKLGEALNLSPDELEKILSKSNAKKEERIEQIEPSDCEAQYKN